MTFVGLDLHKRYITACALDDAGAVLGEVRRMPLPLDSLLDFLSAFTKPVTVGAEATLCSQWLHDGRRRSGCRDSLAQGRRGASGWWGCLTRPAWRRSFHTSPCTRRRITDRGR